MRYFILTMVLFFTPVAFASDSLQEQLRETPEMSKRCMENISYYEGKISKYELYIHLKGHQKLKLSYYRNELKSWEDYCYTGSVAPDFDPDFN